MTIVKVSKKKIMKAIMNEPMLKAGHWIDKIERDFFLKEAEDCAVCAVGSVMREILDNQNTTGNLDDACFAAVGDVDSGVYLASPYWVDLSSQKSLEKYAKSFIEKTPMAALSCYFEGMSRILNSNQYRLQIGNVKRSVVAFVKKHFPNHVLIDINGALPAKDVTIVKGPE